MKRPARAIDVVRCVFAAAWIAIGFACAQGGRGDEAADAFVLPPMRTQATCGGATCGSCQVCDDVTNPSSPTCVACGGAAKCALIPGPGYTEPAVVSTPACSAGACTLAITYCGAYACSPAAGVTAAHCDNACGMIFGGGTFGTCASYAACNESPDPGSPGYCQSVVLGSPCASALDCSVSSGSHGCVNGACCSSASCPVGQTCNSSKKPGYCLPTLGSACSADAECGSGHCVDNVCCESTCAGECEACDVGPHVGTCSPVLGAPRGARPACPSGSDVACKASCNGTDTKACHFAPPTIACGTSSCSSGIETRVGTCDGSGGCAASTKSCGSYVCGASTCKVACGGDVDCAAGYFCQSSSCTPKTGFGKPCTTASACGAGLFCTDGYCCGSATCAAGASCGLLGHEGTCTKLLGRACTASIECGSGNCVDGVCCDVACTNQCQACDVAGHVGTCSNVTGAPHAARAACSGAASDPKCGPSCDGADGTKCNEATAAVSCGVATCSAGVATHVGTCNGAGGCADTPSSCGAFACGPTTCKTSCAADGDCAAGYYCKGGTCTASEGLGKPCSGSSSCGALTCTDGFCCGVAKCDAASTCGYPGHEGTCIETNGSACKADVECGSNHCVDGVCCDSACSGQCEACDVPDSTSGRPGKCIPVKGKPHGSRAVCGGGGTGGGDVCASSTCDGAVTTSCASFAGGDTTCRASSCKDGVYTAPSTCDGKGHCPDAITTRCDGLACTGDGTACRGSCATNDDCLPGFKCEASSGKCTRITAKCSDDGLSSTGADGVTTPCGAYRCNSDGVCAPSCVDSSQCAPGNTCDATSKTCNAAGGTGSSGGCAFGHGDDATLSFLLVLAGAAAIGRRRRASSSSVARLTSSPPPRA